MWLFLKTEFFMNMAMNPTNYVEFNNTLAGTCAPSRKDFTLRDADLCEETWDTISRGAATLFMPTTVDVGTHERKGCLNVLGFLPNGSKARLVLTEVPTYVDVRDSGDPSQVHRLREFVESGSGDWGSGVEQIESVAAYPLKGYTKDPVRWHRIFFNNSWNRKRAIERLWEAKYETASDDRNFPNQVSRDHGISWTSWIHVACYEVAPKGSRLLECDLVAKLADVRALDDPISDNPPPVEFLRTIPRQAKALAQDRALVCCFDIETYTPDKHLGTVPMAENRNDTVFMICMTAHWLHDKTPLAKVCLVTQDCEPDERWHTVKCRSEREMLLAFADLFGMWAPDVVTGFNDGGYDWPFISKRAEQYGILCEMDAMMNPLPKARSTESDLAKWRYRSRMIKISADLSVRSRSIDVPGCVAVDTCIVYRRLFPRSEKYSLNHFLKMMKLDTKVDMPYERMWKIYEESRDLAARAGDEAGKLKSAAEMREVAHYCVVDAMRCQELLLRKKVLANYREVGNYSFTTFSDTIFRANGHKVCNMLGAYAQRAGMVMSMRHSDTRLDGKYPGAHVVPPNKGLEEDLPVTGLDYSSLYPSLIRTYNLSPDKFVDSKSAAEALEAEGESVHEVNFEFNGTVRGWFVRHNNEDAKRGIFSRVLGDLFDKRAAMKVRVKRLEANLESFEILEAAWKGREAGDRTDFLQFVREQIEEKRDAAAGLNDKKKKAANARIQELEDFLRGVASEATALKEFQQQIASLEFEFSAVDAKQKAVKVFMNTFYGEAGNQSSPIFMLALAGGVTAAGRYNILLIEDFVQKKNFGVKYGDTDSLYLTCPLSIYDGANAEYRKIVANLDPGDKNGKDKAYKELCKEKVRLTMDAMGVLRDEVNAYLHRDNGSKFLKMAYEEVLYPVVFTGKKKYFGIAHVNEPNFDISDPSKIFVRGIDAFIKQGQTQLARTICTRCLWAATRLRRPEERHETLRQMVERIMREALGEEWDFNDFIQSDCWKPNKQNVSVQTFMRRMRTRHRLQLATNERLRASGGVPEPLHYIEPEPGSRFEYVIVKSGEAFDRNGRRRNPSKGEKMEYVHAVKANGLAIDKGYYLASYVAGTCARFINYEDDFQKATDSSEEADKKSQDRAKRHLTKVINEVNGLDAKTMRDMGTRYRKMYRESATELSNVLEGQGMGLLAPSYELSTFVVDPDDTTDEVNLERKFLEDYQERAMNAAREVVDGEDLVNQTLRATGVCPRTGRDVGTPPGSERVRLYALLAAMRSRGPRTRGNLAANHVLVYLEREKRATLNSLRSCFRPLKEAGELIDDALNSAIERRRKDDAAPIELLLDSSVRERATAAGDQLLNSWRHLLGVEINRLLHEKIVDRLRELQLKTAP